jgi:hypothetical protein
MLTSDLLLLLPALLVFFLLLALRRRPAVAAADKPPARAIVVDGSNVMHWGGAPSAKVLARVLQTLKAKGHVPIVFFDANVGYQLSDRYMNEHDLAQLIDVPKAHICVVDKGVIADQALLAFAADHGLRVVSNDRFRDWRVQFPHLARKGAVLRGGFANGAVIWDRPLQPAA